MHIHCVTVLNKRYELAAQHVFQPAKCWLLCLFLAGTSIQAHATTPCEPNLQGQALSASVDQLRKLEPSCYKYAPFLYTFGQTLNKAGFYDEAVDRLESALMYRPGHWPTQLEYAIALEGAGDSQSAANLIQSLIQNTDVDSLTRQQLQALQSKPPPSAFVERRGRFSVMVGYDSNLFSSTYHSQFTLTTPDGLLPVELDQDQRPRAGAFARTEVGYGGLLSSSDTANWRYNLVASYRSNPSYNLANYGQVGVLLERSANNNLGPYLLGQHQALIRGGSVVLRQTQVSAGYDFPLRVLITCQQRIGVDFQHVGYPTSAVLDGRYTGLTSSTNCPISGLQAQLRVGQDQPIDQTKPGGAQQQASIRLSKRNELGNAALTLEAEASHQKDQSGYSPLLSNNARRQISRVILRAEYRWSVGSISPYVALEALQQRSNLSLFEFKGQSVTLGISSRW